MGMAWDGPTSKPGSWDQGFSFLGLRERELTSTAFFFFVFFLFCLFCLFLTDECNSRGAGARAVVGMVCHLQKGLEEVRHDHPRGPPLG